MGKCSKVLAYIVEDVALMCESLNRFQALHNVLWLRCIFSKGPLENFYFFNFLCYLSMWNVTLEHTASHFIVVYKTRPGNPFLNAQLYDAGMVVASREFGSREFGMKKVHQHVSSPPPPPILS